MNDKETLEEAKIHHVNKWVKGYDHLNLSDFEKNSIAVDFGNGWDKAIKFQQEISYSEEEVLKIIQDCKSYLSFGDEFDEIKWFEQFKSDRL